MHLNVFTHFFPIHPTSVAIASVPQMAASVAVTWQTWKIHHTSASLLQLV